MSSVSNVVRGLCSGAQWIVLAHASFAAPHSVRVGGFRRDPRGVGSCCKSLASSKDAIFLRRVFCRQRGRDAVFGVFRCCADPNTVTDSRALQRFDDHVCARHQRPAARQRLDAAALR